MKKLFFVMSALAALSLLAPSSGVAQDINQIGIYLTEDGPFDSANAQYTGDLPSAAINCFAVITNPFNDNTTQAPIETLGGYEFKVILPAGFFLVGSTLPPNVLNLSSSPTFYCAGQVPVVDSRATLVSMTLATFSETEGLIYLAPVDVGASIPGGLAITDAGDNFVLSEAYPSSGDFANPVFGLALPVVPTEDASWGEVKSLFR